MSAQYTPGPWRVDDWQYAIAGREHVPTIRTDADAVAEALPLWGDYGLQDREGERLANAALIADAPAMLALIARLLNNPGVPSVEQEAIELLARHGVQP